MTTLHLRKSIGRSPLRRALLLIPLVLVCFGLSPTVRAVSPAPDGGYANGNTAEGTNALFSLTTGVWNTANGNDALFSTTTGNVNIAVGLQALFSNTSGSANTAVGMQALLHNTTGSDNTAVGTQALYNNTSSVGNIAIGFQALANNTIGNSNMAIGFQALVNNTTGSGNIALGEAAGASLTGSDNIDIGTRGAPGESNTIRIGTEGTQNAAFIAGIFGGFVNLGDPVIIDSNGFLGTVVSSQRFKSDIKPMDKASDAILALKPVTFHYKKELDPKGIPQFGLVAEEVEKVNPALVTRDAKGEVHSVRYDAVNAMLLNEFLKEHRKVEAQEATIAQLKKGMTVLTASLKEQAAQIQKVSAQIEASKPAPQVVNNP